MEAVATEAEATAAVVAGTNLEDAVSKVKATLATVPAKSRLLKRSLKATPADNTKDNTTRFVADLNYFLSYFFSKITKCERCYGIQLLAERQKISCA